MAKIPRELKDLLTEPHNISVATTGSDGMPNVSIKGSGTLLDDERLYLADMFSRKTRENLEHDRRVAVGIHDPERRIAMQVKGTAELIDKGALFERVAARLADLNASLPPLRSVVKISVESVWDMSPGVHAGYPTRSGSSRARARRRPW